MPSAAIDPNRVTIRTCQRCGFDFTIIGKIVGSRPYCDQCSEIRREERKASHRSNVIPPAVHVLGDYNMAAELTRQRLAIEMAAPLIKMGKYRTAYAVLMWASAPARDYT